jgi:hypothetical protein
VLELITQHLERALALLADPARAADHWLAFGSAALAGVLVIVSAFVKTMIPLRSLAVGSNLGFIVYGVVHPSVLMVLLHGVLLPVNLWRVVQMVRLTRRVHATAVDSLHIAIWLRPYMRSKRHRAGRVLFERGQRAERMYLLADGAVDLPDVGRRMEAGQMFGEIAFFAPDGRRSSSAVCATDCTVLSIDRDTFLQLVHQNPDFGLEVLRLVAGRMSQDVQRLQGELRRATQPVPADGPPAPHPAPPQEPAPPAPPR